MKDFFPESSGPKHGCTLYTGAHYIWQNIVHTMSIIIGVIIPRIRRTKTRCILYTGAHYTRLKHSTPRSRNAGLYGKCMFML